MTIVIALVATSTPASAATFAPIDQLGEVQGIEWDAAHDRVYTTNWARSFVDVWTMEGTPVASIPITGPASDLVVEEGVLFAAIRDTDQIAKIDVSSLAVLGYLQGPWGAGASTLDVAGGRVWFSTPGSMESIAIEDDTDVESYAKPAAAMFAPVPGKSDTLLAWTNSDLGATFYEYDVAGGTRSLVQTFSAPEAWVEHVAVAPDATRFYYSYGDNEGIPWAVAEVRMSDFSKVDDYSVPGWGQIAAIAVDPTGEHIAVADLRWPGGISVFAHGADAPVRSIDLGQTCVESDVLRDGLAFGATASTLSSLQRLERSQFVTYDDPTSPVVLSTLVVNTVPASGAPGDTYTVQGQLSLASGSPGGRKIRIWAGTYNETTLDRTVTTEADGSFSFTKTAVLDDPCLTARFEGTAAIEASSDGSGFWAERLTTTVTIDAVTPKTVAPTEPVTITGTVSVEGGEDQSGREMTLHRQIDTGGRVSIPFLAGPDGSFSIVDNPPNEGRASYSVSAEETDRWNPGFASAPYVAVRKRNPGVSLTTSTRAITYGARVNVTFTIPADSTNRTVRIYETPAGTKQGRVIFRGEVDGDGSVTIRRQPPVSMAYEGVYEGDARYRGDRQGRDVAVRALVRSKLLKASGSDGAWKLYRANQPIFFGAAVIPDQTGRWVTISVERLVSGTWKPWFADSFKLQDGSVVVIYIRPGVIRAGTPCRIRASYDRDPMFVRSSSPYRYFKII